MVRLYISMDTGDDILSVIFLALICIVIAGIVTHLTPSGLVLPTYALIAICLWIAYDYMLRARYNAKVACLMRNKDLKQAEDNLEDLAEQLKGEEDDGDKDGGGGGGGNSEGEGEAANADEEQEGEPGEQSVENAPTQLHANEFDIGMFNANANAIQNLHSKMGCGADTQIANRMKYMGLQAKLSQDIRARHNKYKLMPYFDEELKANENRDWWDVENDYLDNFM